MIKIHKPLITYAPGRRACYWSNPSPT